METATQTVIDVDETVPELPFKDVFFRIYRDIRFSKIKTPYKVRRKKNMLLKMLLALAMMA